MKCMIGNVVILLAHLEGNEGKVGELMKFESGTG